MASVNKESLREEFGALKERFGRLCTDGKVTAESRALFEALLMLLQVHFHNDCSVRVNGVVSYYRSNPEGADVLERKAAEWEERLPEDHANRWQWCLKQDRETLLSLLAYCAERSVDAVRKKEDSADSSRLADADRLAAAVGLDMTEWFTPTAENYFQRISRPQIISAIAEATNRPAKLTWDKLKKSELAALAERETAGTGWLPKPIRA